MNEQIQFPRHLRECAGSIPLYTDRHRRPHLKPLLSSFLPNTCSSASWPRSVMNTLVRGSSGLPISAWPELLWLSVLLRPRLPGLLLHGKEIRSMQQFPQNSDCTLCLWEVQGWEPRYKSCCCFHLGPVPIEQNLVRGYPIPNAELHPVQSLISHRVEHLN